MKYDFNKVINRYNTHCYKWDCTEALFGAKDLLPMWVADMDFLSPPAVVEAMVKRAEHGVYGYTVFTDDVWAAVRGWYKTRHSWEIPQNTLVFSPGVVNSLSIIVDCFTKPGEEVVIMPPVYYPFFEVVQDNGRQVRTCPLILQDNRYIIDFARLEELFRQGIRLLIFCNPHNPGGRVWTREELAKLGKLSLKYNVLVVSDEIHCDLALQGSKYVPYASVSPEMAENSIICLAPSKTFNIPGIQSSFVVSYNQERKEIIQKKLKALNLNMPNCFVPEVVKACYEQGAGWLDEVLQYIEENLDTALEFISNRLPELVPMRPEASYLLWVNYRGLGLDSQGLKDLMYHKARVVFSEGSIFGVEGEGYLRINLACPRSLLLEGLSRFAQAVHG